MHRSKSFWLVLLCGLVVGAAAVYLALVVPSHKVRPERSNSLGLRALIDRARQEAATLKSLGTSYKPGDKVLVGLCETSSKSPKRCVINLKPDAHTNADCEWPDFPEIMVLDKDVEEVEWAIGPPTHPDDKYVYRFRPYSKSASAPTLGIRIYDTADPSDTSKEAWTFVSEDARSIIYSLIKPGGGAARKLKISAYDVHASFGATGVENKCKTHDPIVINDGE